MTNLSSRPALCRPGTSTCLDLASLTAAFIGVVGYTVVSLPLMRDGAVRVEALAALRDFIADHAEEALGEIREAEGFIGAILPGKAVTEERALRSTGGFLVAARRWLDEALDNAESVRRRDVNPTVEPILADAVILAR